MLPRHCSLICCHCRLHFAIIDMLRALDAGGYILMLRGAAGYATLLRR